jgi:sialate O-acetylesterase
MKKIIVLLIAISISLAAYTQVRLPRLIGDGMVVQRNKPVVIWGWASPKEKIAVQFQGQQRKTAADRVIGVSSLDLSQREARIN